MSADPAPSPAWTPAPAYLATPSADPAVWAWEFARRASGRPLDAATASPGAVAPDLCYAGAGPGGDGAPAVIWRWQADATLPVLGVRPAQSGERDRLDLRALNLPALVVRDAVGDQHVLVADGLRRLRFAVVDGDILAGPSVCFFKVPAQSGGAASLEGLRRLMHLQACGRLPLARPARAARTTRWLAALRAYDARRGGASQRDIACLLFGERRVAEDWNGRSNYMRMRVQRLVRVAETLVRGGYRALFGLGPPRDDDPRIVEVWRSAQWIAGGLLLALAAPAGRPPGLA